MRDTTSKLLPIMTALVMSFGLAACAGAPQSDTDGSGESSLAAGTGELEAAEGSTGRGEEGGEEHAAEGSGERRDEAERGEEGEHGEGGEGEEHGEGGEGEGEESGVYIAQGATWDVVRRGARLVLSYNSASNAFVGTVENTTQETLCSVRVEVHLSSGTELGPTAPTNVGAGGTLAVELQTEGESFDTWTAHPELSACSGG